MCRRNSASKFSLRSWCSAAVALSALALLPAGANGQCPDEWPLRRAMFMYTNNPLPTAVLDQIADRFDFAVEGYRGDISYMLNRNSRFKFMATYNSLTDNYVTENDAEHLWLMQNAGNFGLIGEDAYLHFSEDTVIELQGQQVSIPGWNPNRSAGDPPASAPSRDQARCAVYFADLRRRVTNFSTQAVRDLNIAHISHVLQKPFTGGHYPGGVMFDNSAHQSLQVRIVSGGGVAEHPNHATFNSQEFVDWYWMGGVRVYLEQLMAHVRENRAQFGDRHIYIIPNTANAPYIGSTAWESSYINPPAADILALEFEYNPTRDFGRGLPGIIYQKHTMALNAGVSLFETGYLFKGRGDLQGSFTDAEAVMNNIGTHWVHRADDAGLGATTYLLGVNVWDAYSLLDQWMLNLKGAFDVDLGRPLGAPFLMQQGTDGKGYPYEIWGRRLSCGLAITRHRDPYDGDFDAATAVTVDLGDVFAPIDVDGNLLPPVSQWTLRNGQAQIFMASDAQRDTMPPEAPGKPRLGKQ